MFIGSKENSYSVLPGLPANIQGYHWQFGITIVTPDRKFLFACETKRDQQDWMAALQSVIDRPMLPQEYAGKLNAQLKALFSSFSLSFSESAVLLSALSAVEAYFKRKP